VTLSAFPKHIVLKRSTRTGSREDDPADVTQAQLIEEMARGLRISAYEWKLGFADQGAGILSATVAGS
jgi:hypothetical protein